jgi:hypothetical protein
VRLDYGSKNYTEKCEAGCALNAAQAAGHESSIQFDNYDLVNQEIIHGGTRR